MANFSANVRRTRIGLLDFEPIRVTGLREILARRADFDVVATDLGNALRRPDFDLVLMLARRRVESYALLGRLKDKNPELKAIVVSSETDDDTVMAAIASGAKG